MGCSSGIGFASRPGAVRGATRILLGLVLAARAAHAAPSVLVAIGDRSPLGLPFSRFSEVALDGPDGLFSWDGSALGRIAVVGDASPAGGAFTSVGLGTLNDAGVCAFRASISSGPRAGIFRAVVSAFPTLATVALEGDATPIGGTLETFPTSLAPSVNAGGDVAFRATLAGDGVPSAGVFVAAAAGSLNEVVAVGEPTAVGKLVRLREVVLADDGSVLVRATLPDGAPGLVRVRQSRGAVAAATPIARGGFDHRRGVPTGAPAGHRCALKRGK